MPQPSLSLALLGAVLHAPALLAQSAPGELVEELPEVIVQSRRFEEQRISIAPALGATVYEIDRATIERLPQGSGASLNNVLLQAPGVAGDSQGDIHVRGDHRNLQYRINGVIIPEAISGFAQLFEARALQSVSLITGALPAQFGYRTAGIVDLRLRSGAQDPGGSAELYGGSFGTVQPSLYYGNTIGPFEYFITGNYLQSNRGFDNPTADRNALNNDTQQLRGLVNLGYVLDDRTRLAFFAGTSQSRFQIPNVPGQPAAFTAFGQDVLDSANLRSRQWQRGSFGVLAVQHAQDALDVQISAFARRTSLNYLPDLLGEMLANGVATDTRRNNLSYGLQGDAAWRVAEQHTIRFGFFASTDTTRNTTDTTVLPLDGAGGTIDAPFSIQERGRLSQNIYGLYLQDEWRLTDRVTANFGARFDLLDGPASGNQLSPRVNLVWRATDTTTFAAGYARYYTPPPAELLAHPNLNLYLGSSAEPATLRADPVQPESSNYYNIGVSQKIGENLTFGLEGYYRLARNLQDLGQFGAAYIFSPYNYEQGRVFGTEATASYRSGNLLTYANLAYGRAEGKNPVSNQYLLGAAEAAYAQNRFVRLDHLQTLTGSAGAAYRVWDGGNISSTLVYASGLRKGFANSESVTPYLTANFSFSQDFEFRDTGRWSARVDLLNVGDRAYQLRDGTGLGVSAAQYGLRRGIYVGLSRAL